MKEGEAEKHGLQMCMGGGGGGPATKGGGKGRGKGLQVGMGQVCVSENGLQRGRRRGGAGK